MGCIDCGEEHHTDRYFNPEASIIFCTLPCGSCVLGGCLNRKCMLSQTYTKSSLWSAYKGVDRVHVGRREPSMALLDQSNNAFRNNVGFGVRCIRRDCL